MKMKGLNIRNIDIDKNIDMEKWEIGMEEEEEVKVEEEAERK